MKISTIIADDHKLFAQGLSNILGQSDEIEIKAVVHNGKALVQELKNEPTDLALIDLNMPELDGIGAIKQIQSMSIKTKLIILSTYADEKLVEEAKNLKVDAYLLKDAEPEELLYTIKEVMENRYEFNLNHILKQTEPLENFSDDFLKKYKLSRREIEIIQLLKKGLTNQEIADKIFLSVLTIQTHRKNIIQKLEVNNTAGLIAFAHEHNI
ncbi:MAG: response regulator [Bacteroidota bacterium]